MPMHVPSAPTAVPTATPVLRTSPPQGWPTAGDQLFGTNFDVRFILGDRDNITPYNGYWWVLDRSSWVPGMVSNRTWFLPSPQYTIGNATYYANGVMEATARTRGLSLDGYKGGVSLLSPADISATVWLRRQGMDWEGPFLVVDCARRADIWPVIYYRGEVVEVDFRVAQEWGMVSPTYVKLSYRLDGVEVYRGENPPHPHQTPTDLRLWWIPRVEFVDKWEWPPIYEKGGTWREPTRYVKDGMWVSTPVYATTYMPPAAIVPMLDAECQASWRYCGEARQKLIEWGVY